MGPIFLLIGVLLAVLLVLASAKIDNRPARGATLLVALLCLALGLTFSSLRYVGSDEVGLVTKTTFGAGLKDGRIIATGGEMGVQADVLPPGWHWGYWPIVYTVQSVPLTEIKADEVGLMETSDGVALPDGQLFAPIWDKSDFQKMLDAKYFLTSGKGCKGKQTTVLTPGKYRLNTDLFRVRMVKQTEILPGEVAVLKANFGIPPSVIVKGAAGMMETGEGAADASKQLRLAGPGEMGILADPLPPGKYPLNTDAFGVTELWTTQMIAHFTASGVQNPVSTSPDKAGNDRVTSHMSSSDEREIRVITSDGFNFPVDVRVEYLIEAANAPVVVAKLGDDEGDRFRNALNSAVRAIFRNNAESVRALDYVQQRSHQESQSLTMLREQMARFGVTVTAVRIGNVGDEKTLGKLLETQMNREIAKQEQLTTMEQQRAAEQKKALAKTTQESDEEKRLATATYDVKIAEQGQKKRVVEAEAEAQATTIKAKAQSEAFRLIAEQIGKNASATIEMLKIVGERNILITPRVMIGAARDASAPNSALIGTMLDSLTSRADESNSPPANAPSTPDKRDAKDAQPPAGR